MFFLFFTSLFFQNYPVFFMNIRDIKFYSNFKKDLIFLLLMLYLIFIDLAVNCIFNNGNILTDGKWRCYNEMGHRICYRNN